MEKLLQKKIFSRGGGLNQDDDPRNVPNSDTFACYNTLRFHTEVGAAESIENLAGSIAIPNIYLPTMGINKSIGKYEDTLSSCIFDFNYNSLGNHAIYSYNTKDDTVTQVFADSSLKFNKDFPITGAALIAGVLYFTDNNNSMRKIDTNLFKGTTTPITQYYADNIYSNTVLLSQYNNLQVQYADQIDTLITAINPPPLYPPTGVYGTDTSRKSNNLQGYLFQYAYRHVFYDYGVSVLSPWSKIPLPINDELATGGFDETNPSLNNVITLFYNTGANNVYRIDIMAQQQGATAKNTSGQSVPLGFTIIAQIYKSDLNLPDNSIATVNFYNDVAIQGQDQQDMNRPFDYVGQKTGALTLINSNTLLQANVVEGYDNVPVNVGLKLVSTLADFAGFSMVNIRITYEPYGYPDAGTIVDGFITILVIPPITLSGMVLTLNLSYRLSTFIDPSGSLKTDNFIIETTLGETQDDVARRLYDKLLEAYPLSGGIFDLRHITGSGEVLIYAQAKEHFAVILIPYHTITDYYLSAIIDTTVTQFFSLSQSKIYKSYKSASTKNFAIAYYDKFNRSGGANKSEQTSIHIPSMTEIADAAFNWQNGANFSSIFQNQIQWAIYHKAPSWAVAYQWLEQSTIPTFYQQYWIDLNADIDKARVDDSSWGIKLNHHITELQSHVHNSNLVTYNYTPGDRWRLMYYLKAIDGNCYYTQLIDQEIIGYDNTTPPGEILTQPVTGEFVGTSTFQYAVIEVYTPAKKFVTTQQFNEIGEVYPILTDHWGNKIHTAPLQANIQKFNEDGTLQQPATGVFDSGDCYIKLRYGLSLNIPVESMNYSDYYASNLFDYGRVNFAVDNMRQQRLQIIRWSQAYIQNSQTNGLCSFYADDYVICDESFGAITGLLQKTDLLKVIQQSKNTSYMIDKRVLSNADGSTSIVATDKILNLLRPNAEIWGTVDPTSIVSNDRHYYYFDIKTAAVIRNSANGQVDVANEASVKMTNFFQGLKTQLDAASKYECISTYSDKFKCLITTFNIYEFAGVTYHLTNTYTLMFHDLEGSNRWITFLTLQTVINKELVAPEMYASLDNTVIAFINGQIHKLFADTNNYNNFFGSQFEEEIDVYANAGSGQVQIFNALGLITNNNNPDDDQNAWYVKEISTTPSAVNPKGMLTTVHNRNFKMKQGVLWAAIPKNINTAMKGSDNMKRINGEPMYGDSCLIKLANKSDKSVVLNALIIKSTLSDRVINSEK